MSSTTVAASRAVLLASVALALGACDVTHFQSPPGSTVSACDESFVGAWLLTGPDEDLATCRSKGDCDFVVVDAHCSGWHGFEKGVPQDDKDRAMMSHVHVEFADIRHRKVISLGIDADSATPDDSGWPRQHLFFRYEAGHDIIRLYGVDGTRVEQLIAANIVHGWTKKAPLKARPGAAPSPAVPGAAREPGFLSRDIYVQGDANEMARIALLPGVFEDSPFVLLKRVDPADIVTSAPGTSSP